MRIALLVSYNKSRSKIVDFRSLLSASSHDINFLPLFQIHIVPYIPHF